MAKIRTTVFLTPDDREAVETIRDARMADSDGAAIRYAIRVVAALVRDQREDREATRAS